MGTEAEKTVSDLNSLKLCLLHLSPPGRLAAQLAELEATIKQKQQENSHQEEQLASLRPTLERLKQATQPVQEFFKMPLDWEKEQHSMALLLPP